MLFYLFCTNDQTDVYVIMYNDFTVRVFAQACELEVVKSVQIQLTQINSIKTRVVYDTCNKIHSFCNVSYFIKHHLNRVNIDTL